MADGQSGAGAEVTALADIVDSGQSDEPLNKFGNRENKFSRNFDDLKV